VVGAYLLGTSSQNASESATSSAQNNANATGTGGAEATNHSSPFLSETTSTSMPATNNATKQEVQDLQSQINQLKAQQPTTNPVSQPSQENSSDSSVALSSSLINEIEPTIVEINCIPPDMSSMVSGSGASVRKNGNGAVEIITNYHVYAEAYAEDMEPPTCFAVYPEPPDFSFNDSYGDYPLTLENEYSHYNPDTYEDIAVFSLGPAIPSSTPLSQIPAINDITQFPPGHNLCSDVNVGDGLTIFGYPSSGNLLGVSETVTKGIVSGILPGPIYKTDAPIDHGNSGGIAILNKTPCILGIPTLGESGLTAGIGYIQSFNLAEQPTN
jgi:S1-C subfamily serine protease